MTALSQEENKFYPLRQLPHTNTYKKGDVLVLFGELFNKGYANGLIEEAEKIGMTIVYCTVGRRDSQGNLRPLIQEEMLNIPEPFINIPLEAGFDLERDEKGFSPVDYLRSLKLTDWDQYICDEASLKESHSKGTRRFKEAVKNVMKELNQIIPETSNVLFAHLMAGGVPRSKIVMPLMNRAVKGTGDRYLESEKFWLSGVGQICAKNFNSVTAETFSHLIEGSEDIRLQVEKRGKKVSYLAYGYHGTEVLIGQQRVWQTYTPYVQGWAKLELERLSRSYFNKGISCCVYNCPEILTASTSVFQGVEVSLYPLISSLKATHGNEVEVKSLLERCERLLKTPDSLNQVIKICDDYFNSEHLKKFLNFEKWPQHSTKEQLSQMLETSDQLISLHSNPRQLMTELLSEAVFQACGFTMLHDSWSPTKPIVWINHDLVAKYV